jgi:hypothetical protein
MTAELECRTPAEAFHKFSLEELKSPFLRRAVQHTVETGDSHPSAEHRLQVIGACQVESIERPKKVFLSDRRPFAPVHHQPAAHEAEPNHARTLVLIYLARLGRFYRRDTSSPVPTALQRKK